MRNLLCSLLAVVACVASVACAQPQPLPTTGQASPTPSPSALAAGNGEDALPPITAPDQLVNSLNGFSQRMYLLVARQEKGNLAVSPLGSYILLEILRQGAAGKTQKEIAASTGLYEGGMTDLAGFLKGLDQRESLALAQKIYLDKTATLLPGFLKNVAALLAEPVQVLDLRQNPEGSRKVINDWVSEHTAGLIKALLPELPPDTVSVLVSALHFKGGWKTKFNEALTQPGEFHPAPGQTISTAMMTQSEVPTLEVAGARGVILPYQEDFDMVFLLPKDGQSVDALAAELDLSKLPLRAQGPQVTLRLPRFEFAVPTFQLTETWQQMGLAQTVQNPDLTPMIRLEKARPLRLKIYHQTYIKVNEEGTEAAAATAVTMSLEGAARREPPSLVFNRPFLFVLRHSGSGAVLMLGRVENP